MPSQHEIAPPRSIILVRSHINTGDLPTTWADLPSNLFALITSPPYLPGAMHYQRKRHADVSRHNPPDTKPTRAVGCAKASNPAETREQKSPAARGLSER